MHRTAPRRSSIRALALGALVTVAATRPAPGVTANGVFAVSGLPGLEAISLRQIGSALHMCAIAGPDIVKAADGTIDVASGAFTLEYVPAVLGPGGLGAYCSITVSGTVAADGMSLTGTQTEHSTCVPPPFTCVPGCVLSATLPFTGTRTSATPAPCCGDAFPNPGEQCDDGNDATGDCCAPDCTPEPAGGTCPDAFDDPCTTTTCDGFGHCLHENSCAHQPLVGTKLLLKRAGTREKLVWLAKDPSLAVPALGGPDDPSLAGARLELFAPLEPRALLTMPAGTGTPGWTAIDAAADTYKFRNREAPLGSSPVRVAVLRDGRTLKVVARDAGFDLTSPLIGVGIRLVTGSLATCSYFAIGSSIVTDVPGRFEARNSPNAGLCDRGTLGVGSPGGAFAD